MKRHAFTMKLKPGFEEEYKKRHDEIWPELEKVLSEAGIHNYSIFLDEETGTLFAYQELEESHQDVSDNPVVQKWWSYMADIMETNPDDSPVENPLKEVFYME
ncbi:MAG: L-rhamnose mutarotase [Balneolaceae bacterium]|nr:L-rhamnose mutarotase [Balneolaceae bacterium]